MFHFCRIALVFGLAFSPLAGTAAETAAAQAPQGISRKALQREDLSAPGREVIQVLVGFEPGAAFPGHSHPGEEIVYVTEGSLIYEVKGRPPVTLAAGDVLFIPAGAVHAVRNDGDGNAAELATYVVEKGKPLITLAQQEGKEK